MLSLYRLPRQEPGEKVIKVIRRDLFILLKKVVYFMALLVLPFLFVYFLVMPRAEDSAGPLFSAISVLGASSYLLFIWLFFFFSFIDYYLDVWIITSERIIDIEQRGFFSRVISEQKLFRVQDVTSEIHGALPTIFSYGDVHIQTAGAKERFRFRQVPDPDRVRDMIIRLAEESRARHPGEK